MGSTTSQESYAGQGKDDFAALKPTTWDTVSRQTLRSTNSCCTKSVKGLNDAQVANILLVQAVMRDDLETVERALRMGANVETTVPTSIKVGESRSLPNGPDGGKTPLMRACELGYDDVVDLLLRKGADISAMEDRGFNPLCFALAEGHLELAARLMAVQGAQERQREVLKCRQEAVLSDLRNNCETGPEDVKEAENLIRNFVKAMF